MNTTPMFITIGEKHVLTLEILNSLLRTSFAQFNLALEKMKCSMALARLICEEVNSKKR